MKKKIIWTDFDLDGAGSALVLKWATEDNYEIRVTSHRKFRSDFLSWVNSVDLNDYDSVTILDIDCSEHNDIVDFPQAVIFDHHAKHALQCTNKDFYVHAQNYVKEFTSCTKLLLKFWMQIRGKKFTKEQLYLVALIDDYDCYALKLKDTLNLNTVFWSYSGNKIDKFIEDFQNGFQEFTNFHKNVIALYNKKFEAKKIDLDIFTADIPRNGKTYKFVSTFCDFAINEIADYIIRETNADVGIVINKNTGMVNIRRKATGDYPVDAFAQQICEGAGSSTAAGGKLTERFATLSKIFKPYVR